jgi:MOSC domain-containing protein YiiM
LEAEPVAVLAGIVISVHAGSNGDLSKDERPSIQVELDGIKQLQGTVRRNERQWSAVSAEELSDIAKAMDLAGSLTPTELGANLCISGIPELSRLPKGTVLKFPSGAELIVEEYNPPCHDMGKKLAGLHTTQSGNPLSSTAFSKAAKLSRGIVGVVDVPGLIKAGDEVQVELYETPSWLLRSTD